MVPQKDFLAFLETFCRALEENAFIQYLYSCNFQNKELVNLIVAYIWKEMYLFEI